MANQKQNRRRFLQTTGAAAAACTTPLVFSSGAIASEKKAEAKGVEAPAPKIPISLITYGDCGGSPIYWSGVSIDAKLYLSPSKERGLVFFALDRKNPTGIPPYIQMSTSNSEVPAGLDAFLNDNYILAVVSQDLKISDVPQGAQYAMLMKNGAGSVLRRVEQLNTQFTSSVLNGVGYQLLSIPGSGEGLEAMSMPSGVCTFDNQGTQIGYSITAGPDPIMTALLIPVDINGTIMYSPAGL